MLMWIKKLLLILLLTAPAFGVNTFSFRIVLAGADTFTIPIAAGGAGYAHNFTVHWDDGEADSEVTAYNDGDATHSYAGAGTYDIIITGTCEWFGFNGTAADRLLVTAMLSFTGDCGFKVFDLWGCSNMTTIVPLGTMASLTTLRNAFLSCPNITAVPDDMFAGCTAVTSFHYTFGFCYGITTVGTGTFANCAAALDFTGTFYTCSGLTTIGSGMFTDCVNATTFYETFRNCYLLAGLPDGFFDGCVKATSFHGTFIYCYSLATVPANLFANNVLVTNFISAFFDCKKLQLNTTIFYAEADRDTRFLNQTVTFSHTFYRSSAFIGTQGTAPDVWAYNFGTGTPTSTNCFATTGGNNLTSLDNYNSIPVAWGGPYVAPVGGGQLIMIQEF